MPLDKLHREADLRLCWLLWKVGKSRKFPGTLGKPWCVMYLPWTKSGARNPLHKQGTSVQITMGPLALQCSVTASLSMEFVSTALCVRQWLTELVQFLWKSLALNSCWRGLFFKQCLIQEISLWEDLLFPYRLETVPVEILTSPKKSMGKR